MNIANNREIPSRRYRPASTNKPTNTDQPTTTNTNNCKKWRVEPLQQIPTSNICRYNTVKLEDKLLKIKEELELGKRT